MFSNCSSTPVEQEQTQKYFFDIDGYFKQQASSLNRTPVIKTVSKNKVAETKTIVVENWEQELQLFMECDINKPAWKDSYRRDSSSNILTYTATDPELRVRNIKIDFRGQLPQKIEINTKSKNLLYHTTEKLIFIPDSIYEITKHQKVLLLGLNDYEISGRF
ncbi:MAG TPA: hypothetical protein VFM79_06645 [Pelobium sp.]|nr:hypothetical protein [Pelobium sp.]